MSFWCNKNLGKLILYLFVDFYGIILQQIFKINKVNNAVNVIKVKSACLASVKQLCQEVICVTRSKVYVLPGNSVSLMSNEY